MKAPTLRYTLLCALFVAQMHLCFAQPAGCTLKDPVVQIDFGRSADVDDFNTASLSNYDRILGSCPTDGHYTYTPATYDCFRGDWFTIAQDHTPGDVNGNMLLVNASPSGGVFFSRPIRGLTGGRTYEVALWMINVCRLHICCSSLSPTISFQLSTASGRKLASYRIGDLPQRTTPQWRKFAGMFTVPAGETAVMLTLLNSTIGGCGNDFAVDDITFRECVPPKPVIAAAPKKKPITTTAQKPAAAKPVAAKPKEKTSVATTADKPVATTPQRKAVAVEPVPQPQLRPVTAVPVPAVLRTRANPLVRQIETGEGELLIDLYDNGQIDGDTVSVYHNNRQVVAAARLTQTPIRIKVRIDADNPHHELIMVAHNLGSIPPNTSLMIVTAGEERYQVHISSSEQKNAKVVFELKK
ncbi:hypothetical protein [Paracnuella aquatica]|uniref:hypothetical protein n=1 Tax=Paracnuella aquatica TaxID=2268757 RepID=UPI000DEF57B7|nr:hypothetical protein [Paracnuella aquatica]RPD48124.1 hypothetical protein DRJ53_10265 [Paracnuella aquatica]